MPERPHFNDEELARVRHTMLEVSRNADVLARRAHDFNKVRFLDALQALRAQTNELERELLDERLR